MSGKIMEEIDKYICMHTWYDRCAQEKLEVLCNEIGPRAAGSEGIKKGRKYLCGEFEKMGAVNVSEEEVPVRLWHPGQPVLELQGKKQKKYECLHCLFTNSADITKQIADLTGEEIDKTGDKVKDKIALMDGHVIEGGKFMPLPEKARHIYKLGAAGIVLKSSVPTGLPAVETFYTEDLPVTCVGVSKEDGEELSQFAKNGGYVRLYTDGYSEPKMCANLIVNIGPEKLPDEVIVMGAHFDSFWHAPGALDNLTGIVTVMEISRLLAPYRKHFKKTLRVIAYTAEELGFGGSRAYVRKKRGRLDGIKFVINMDSIFPATARGMAVMWSETMRDYIDKVFKETGRQLDVRSMFCMSSDYLAFMLQGIPASRPADFENSFPIWSHTKKDDLDNIRIDWIQQNTMVYAQLLARLLLDPNPLPATRLSRQEVLERLNKENVLDLMEKRHFDIY